MLSYLSAGLQFLKELWSLKILAPVFIFSSGVLALDYFFQAFHVKLEDMNMNITNWIFGVWLLSLAFIVCKLTAWGVNYLMRVRQKAALFTVLQNLLPDEAAVLVYVLNRPVGVTWLPVNDTAAISLSNKGCLYAARNMSANCGALGGNVPCFAYSISTVVRSIIREHRAELEATWGNIPKCNELDFYQNVI